MQGPVCSQYYFIQALSCDIAALSLFEFFVTDSVAVYWLLATCKVLLC